MGHDIQGITWELHEFAARPVEAPAETSAAPGAPHFKTRETAARGVAAKRAGTARKADTATKPETLA